MVIILNPKKVSLEKLANNIIFIHEFRKKWRTPPRFETTMINHLPHKELYGGDKKIGVNLFIYNLEKQSAYLGYTPIEPSKILIAKNTIRFLLKNPNIFREISDKFKKNFEKDYIELSRDNLVLYLPSRYSLKFSS
jgi:hypothetical protein